MIDWTTIRPAIKEQIALCAGLNIDSVVWSKSGQPYHGDAQITLLIDNVRKVGWDEERYLEQAPSLQAVDGPYVDLDGMVLDLEVDEVEYSVTFDITTTIDDVIEDINTEVGFDLASGSDALILTGPTVDGKLQVLGGTANDVLQLPTGLKHGGAVPVMCGQRLFTLAVLASAISHEDSEFALTYLDKIRGRFERQSVYNALNEVDVAILETLEARDRTFNDGQHEWSMYGFNVECGTVSIDIDDVSDGATIESVEMTGTIQSARDGSDIVITIQAPEEPPP